MRMFVISGLLFFTLSLAIKGGCSMGFMFIHVNSYTFEKRPRMNELAIFTQISANTTWSTVSQRNERECYSVTALSGEIVGWIIIPGHVASWSDWTEL